MSNKYTSWLNDINEQTEKPIEHQLDKNEVISKYEFNFEVDEETENYLKEQAYKIHISANKMYNEFGKIFKETQEKLSLKGYGCFYEWFERFLGKYNVKIIVVNNETLSPNEELVQDIISILHVFSCKIYGMRKYKKKIEEDEEIAKSIQNRN